MLSAHEDLSNFDFGALAMDMKRSISQGGVQNQR